MYYSETVTLDAHPNVRFEVSQDFDAEDPREWDREVQILTYRGPRLSRLEDDIERAADSRTMEAFGRVYDESGDDEHALKVAQRYARAYEPDVIIDTFSLRGYSQGDWQDVVVVTPSDGSCGTAESRAETFRQWAYGDVYSVIVQHPHTWHDGDGNTLTTWEDGDSLGGIYADSAEEVAEYYATEYL